MTKRFSYLAFAVVLILSVVLAACAPAATEAPAPTQAPAAQQPTDVPAPVEPTAAPTEAPAPTEAAPAATNTVEPTPAPTAPPPVCTPLATLPTVAAGGLGTADNPITIAFVPSGDSGKITKAGTAIAECLSTMTGLTFKIEVGTSYAASIEAMGANKAQVGFLNTFSVLLAEEKYGVIPVLGNLRKYNTLDIDPDKDQKGQMLPYYKGQFIAKKDSGIASLADLKGKSFCFVEPNSASGYIVPRILLKAAGVDPDTDLTSTNAGSHPNVAIGVYNGDCDAGVTFIDVLSDAAANLAAKYPDIADKVAAFSVTERIPNDGVQVTKELDPAVKEAVVEGLLAMSKDPGGAAVLKSLYSINGFEKIDATFYDEFAGILKTAGVDPATLIK